MDRKEKIHNLINKLSLEVLEFIKEEETNFKDRWVPASHIKNSLELNFVAVPRTNQQYGEKGWLFGIIARRLEDQKRIEYKKSDRKAFYRPLK